MPLTGCRQFAGLETGFSSESRRMPDTWFMKWVVGPCLLTVLFVAKVWSWLTGQTGE